ncbi:hypothetical protein [Streptomyces sp. NPDC057686]|uniref:hypothetical protein n=1 Tax=Streptomyces sp. NPDC057686 TaxID=3346212 RepID=UPI0036AAC1E4
MSTEAAGQQINRDALAEALSNAQLHLDAAVDQLRATGAIGNSLSRLKATEDNNSSCNTACSCGALPDQARVMPR